MLRKVRLISIICLFYFCDPLFCYTLPPVAPGENQSICIVGSTVLVKGLTDQSNSVFINGREIAVGQDGTFTADLIIPLGETEIVVESRDPKGAVKRYAKKILAQENHYFFVGIADGTANFVNTSENYDLRRDNASFDDGDHLNGKLSYYFAGKIWGKYLIKSSLDTDKATQEKLFTNIDPDKYYPVYGDNSTVVYDVNSQGKFYLLIERDRSGLVVGNYQTDLNDDDSKLSNYNRTLYGGKLHLETPARTVYGDPVSKFTGFIAEANQLKGHSEFQATGGSLYYLRHRNIVEGSEQVRIEYRDQHTGMTTGTVSMRENDDYEIKYDEGRILFKKPVLSASPSGTIISDSVQQGGLVYIIVNYEYTSQDAFPLLSEDHDEGTGGIRGSHQITDNIRVGGTYVQEEKDLTNHVLLGADSTFKFGNFTKFGMEMAESRSIASSSYISYNGGYDFTEVAVSDAVRANATRFTAETSLGEYFGLSKEFLNLSGYYQSIDRNFSPSDTLFEAGSKKYAAELDYRLDLQNDIKLIYENSQVRKADTGGFNRSVENELKALRSENVTAQWVHLWKKFLFYTEYRAQRITDSLSEVFDAREEKDTDHILAEKVEYRYSDKTTLFLGQQLGFSDPEDHLSSAGITHEVWEGIGLTARGAVGQDRDSILFGVNRIDGPETTSYWKYEIANSGLDGRNEVTASGSNSRISDKAELRREKQFVSSDTRGVYQSNLTGYKNQITPHLDFDVTYEERNEDSEDSLKGSVPKNAFSGTIRYAKPDQIKASSKLEYRLDTGDDRQLLSDTQGEFKIQQDWHLFGEYEYSRAEDALRGIDTSKIQKHQIGLAYRPVDFDWLNGLFRYTRLQDDRPRDVTSTDGGFMKQKSTYDEIAGEFALDLPWNFQWIEKAAYRDEVFTAVDTNNITETPSDLEAYLLVHRLNYNLTKKLDVAIELRFLRLDGADVNTLEYGPLFETIYHISPNIGIGLGYNATSFKDDLTVLEKKKAEGFFVRLQGKY